MKLILFFLFNLYSNQFAYKINVNDSINTATSQYIIESIKKANLEEAEFLILELDTPGGLVSSTRDIVKTILSSEAPVVVYISPSGSHAGSAGVFITLSSSIAVMAPGTNIGSAHPVMAFSSSTSEDDNAKIIKKKTLNDLLALVESISNIRGRNKKQALLFVKESASVSAEEALKRNVINFIAKDLDELLVKIDGFKISKEKIINTKNIEIKSIPMSFKLRVGSFFSNPNLMFILIIFAALGIYLEFSNPGLFFPGIVGGISLILIFMSFDMIPISTAGIILIILGIILILFEIFSPGFGILGVGGSLSFILGGIFFVDLTKTDINVSYSLVITLGLLFGVFIFLISYFVISSKRKKITTGYEGMIGKEGEVISYKVKTKKGKLKINGEIWSFYYNGDNLKEKVTIVGRDGINLIVE